MLLRNAPIKRRLMLVILLTSVAVLALTSTAFVIYELIASSQDLKRNVDIAGDIIAAQSTVPLMYQGDKEAREILSALRAAEHILKAALYDTNDVLFANYPAMAPASEFPARPPPTQARFTLNRLLWCQPVYQKERRVVTLFLESSLAPIYERLQLYSLIGLIVMTGSVLLALLLSNYLQKSISQPILQLADTARAVSERRDYSVRARKLSADELGLLTDAFNHMLAQIQQREAALRESTDRLRLALQASETGTWDWDIEHNRLNWDESIYRQFGLQPGREQPSFEGFLRRIHPADRELVSQAVRQTIDARSEFNAEFRILLPDGNLRHLSARGKAVYDDTGRAVRLTGVSLDVTQRKRAEETYAFLAAIVSSSEDAIIGQDLNGQIISWNRGAERMFGYTAAEMVGRSMHVLTASDRSKEEATILDRTRSGTPVQYETVRIPKNGRPVQVSLSVSPIVNARGEMVGASAICRDITERKRAEEVLAHQASVLREQAQLLDLANVLARDMDDRIILWSAGMEQMYGWSREEALGKTAHELLSTEYPQPYEEILAKLLKHGDWTGELVHTRRNGQRLMVATHWVLHRNERGEPAAVLQVSNDITERKLAEEEIRRLNAELEKRVRERTAELTEANRELEAFTYSVSHDLRAPLRHIDAFARIIQEEMSEGVSPELRSFIIRIRNGTQTMGRLVDDLLNLSRVGRAHLSWQTVDLNLLVNEVVADLKAELESRQIEWRVLPLPTVECDPGLIKQVFVNLLSNAVKYTRPRDIAIIEVGETTVDHTTAIYVRDNGVGFNMKYVHKLFGVFERLHRPDEFEGTGIGLATVRRIIQKHNGRVWGEAEPDRGAAFYFTLPGAGNAS